MEAKQIYAQCQCCGHIGKVRVYNYDVEDIYLDQYRCPRCKYTIGLNCGENINDIYRYANDNVDPRYY